MNLVLLEGAQRPRWTGETLPAVYDGARQCRRCGIGRLLLLPPVTAEPLFAHGGYGEALRVTVGWCEGCQRVSEVTRETVRPQELRRLG